MAAIVMQQIEVDLVPGGVTPVLHVSQGDYGTRALMFNLCANGQPYTIPSIVTGIHLEGITQKGNEFAVGCSYSIDGTSAVASLTSDMTDDLGLDICQVVLNTRSGRLGCANFFINVELNTIKPAVSYSGTYFADLAKSWAVGDTGIRADEDTNNSKYWCLKSESVASSLNERLADDEKRLLDYEEWAKPRLNKSVRLANYHVINNASNYLIDNDGNKLAGGIYLPVTDATGELAGYPADSAAVGKTYPMIFKEVGLPVMYLNGVGIENLKSKSDGEISNVDIIFPYRSINTTLKSIKVQGASSQSFPKKNYTIKFKDKVVLDPKWGAHKKYVIKADWVDFSHMRNEICAKLWGQIRRTRGATSTNTAYLTDENGNHLNDGNSNRLYGVNDRSLSIGLNYGAIDAYPICVVINGKYWGIYSCSIPKDDWMARMSGECEYEAIVSSESHSLPTRFKSTVSAPNEDGEMAGLYLDGVTTTIAFSIEYVNNSEDTSWISTSLNNLITSVMQTHSTSSEYIDGIAPYVDVESAIDYYIFNCVVNNQDGLDKNYVLDTWDGVKWYFAAYDMDATFGNHWNGESIDGAKGGCTFDMFKKTNRLMELLYLYDKAAIKSRYTSLRSGVLSEANFANLVWNYVIGIPKSAYDYEALRWPSRPGTSVNNYDQILRYFTLRCEELDKEIAAL